MESIALIFLPREPRCAVFLVQCWTSARISRNTVPKIVPSGRLDGLSWEVGRSVETRIFTDESEQMQTALKC